jgi:membrane protein implicated in regulation of membrane protease activity
VFWSLVFLAIGAACAAIGILVLGYYYIYLGESPESIGTMHSGPYGITVSAIIMTGLGIVLAAISASIAIRTSRRIRRMKTPKEGPRGHL